KTVASTNGGTTVQLWELATGKELSPENPGHHSPVLGLAYAPVGKKLASAGSLSQGKTMLWDMDALTAIGPLPGPGGELAHVQPGQQTGSELLFSPDGKKLVTIRNDYWQPGARIVDVATTKETRVIEMPELLVPTKPAKSVVSAAFSLDGRKVITLDC